MSGLPGQACHPTARTLMCALHSRRLRQYFGLGSRARSAVQPGTWQQGPPAGLCVATRCFAPSDLREVMSAPCISWRSGAPLPFGEDMKRIRAGGFCGRDRPAARRNQEGGVSGAGMDATLCDKAVRAAAATQRARCRRRRRCPHVARPSGPPASARTCRCPR